MADCFLRSDMFKVSGVDPVAFRPKIASNCRTAGDFLRLFMEEIVRQQGMERWAETTPTHVLNIREIKATIPNAVFVHVIRDGRDVAVSMAKQGWIKPLALDRERPEIAAGMYWSWVVGHGRKLGAAFPGDYLEISYEDLTSKPQTVLSQVGRFIDQPLDHEQILRAGVGSVSRPNTSFPGRAPVYTGRWREELSEERAQLLEAVLLPTLAELGYATDSVQAGAVFWKVALLRQAYRAWFSARALLKRTPLGRRLVSLSLFEPGAVMAATAG